MAFLTEPAPPRGEVLPVLPGITRLVAANPGPMTYNGTNTYLIAEEDGFAVLDPGPDQAEHVADILRVTGGRVARIILSHTHPDHLGAVPALKAATGAKVWSFHRSQEPSHTPDVAMRDGDEVTGWTAIHTPGHASDHLCFARGGVVFTADHIMSWSTSIVSPPNGNMTDYFASLRLLLARPDTMYLPGHGPMITDPHPFTRALLAHRTLREQAIAASLKTGPKSTMALVDALYTTIGAHLRPAAQRNVIAHLEKLRDEGRAVEDGETWRAA
ncbi:MAG: MBL fold metallo-hydrolase [Acetobacteraceae bacterium]|nr:MBL fold metallo-hydrolase [Acetobacteraceae bacterium]